MNANATTAAQSGSGVPPLSAGKPKRRDAASTLGNPPPNTSSPEGAKENGSRYHVQLPALPKSWSYERFDKVLDVQGGSQPPKSTFVYEPTPGYVQLLQIRDFGERGVPTFVREDSVTKRCTEDDILIARYGASLGRIVTGEKGAYNVALAKVIFDKDEFFNRYLFYLLQTPYFQTPIHMISRSAQNGFNKGDLSDIILPVAPLPEQRRIVAEIEKQFTRLEAGVAALRRVQANLKRYRAAVLKAACEGKLVPTEAELSRQEGNLPAPRLLGQEMPTSPGPFCIYAIKCDDDSIYIGQTDDLARRWNEHLSGQGADWTRSHKPVELVHVEYFDTRTEAVAREKWLKTGFGRKWIKREMAAGRLSAQLAAARQAGLVPTEAELTTKNAKNTKGKTHSVSASSALSAVKNPGYETGEALLLRILAERRKNWTGRGKYKEPAAPDTANLPPLPEGWTWATFGQLCRVQGGFAFKSSDYVKEGIPLVRISNLVNGRVQVAEDTVFLPPNFADANSEFLLRKGDVLIAMSGATTGKMATMEEDLPALLNQRVGRFVLSSAELSNSKFISFLVQQISAKVLKDAYGAAQPNISPGEIEEMPVPLPPLAEQTRIVAEVERRLSVVEELESVVSANLQRATRLRQSILQKAFTGELV